MRALWSSDENLSTKFPESKSGIFGDGGQRTKMKAEKLRKTDLDSPLLSASLLCVHNRVCRKIWGRSCTGSRVEKTLSTLANNCLNPPINTILFHEFRSTVILYQRTPLIPDFVTGYNCYLLYGVTIVTDVIIIFALNVTNSNFLNTR